MAETPPIPPNKGILLICPVCRQELLQADVTEAEKAARPDLTAMMCANPMCPCGRIYMIRKPQDPNNRVAQVVGFMRQLEQRVKFDRAQAEDFLERGEEPPAINPINPPTPPPLVDRPQFPRSRQPGTPWWRTLFGPKEGNDD